MPEEAVINEEQNQVTYNVVLDPSDIARQAEEIRNQLDLALGVGSNSGAQFINTTDFINPQFAQTTQPDFSAMQGQFGSTTDQTFWQKSQEQAEKITEAIGTGFDKIRQDISMLLDRTTSVVQGTQPPPESANPFQELLPDTFGEKLLGSLGFGGDITGPIPPSAYERYSEKALAEDVKDILQNPGTAWNDLNSKIFGDSTVGMVAGMAAYTIPYVGPAMFAADVAAMGDEWLSAAYNKREDLAGGIQEIARQQYGPISMEEARQVAQPMLDFVNSYEGYAKDYNIEEVSQNVLQFANEGGFSKTRNTEQLSEWIKTITEDTRQFARDLGVFQEEAISIMAELAQRSGVSAESVREMGVQMRTYGAILQQNPVDLLGGALQTADQFRQAGMYTTPQTAMQTYIDANVEAQKLVMSTDPYVQSSVYRAGGQQGVAQSLLNIYAKVPQTPLGELMTMGQSFDPTVGGDLNANINTVAQNMLTGDDWWEYKARNREDTLKNKDMNALTLDIIESAKGIYEGIQGKAPTMVQLEGLLQEPGMFGFSHDEARFITTNAQNLINDVTSGVNPAEKIKSALVYTAMQSALENAETTLTGEIAATVIRPIDELGRDVSYEYGEVKRGIVEGVEDYLSDTAYINDAGELIVEGETLSGYDEIEPSFFEKMGDILFNEKRSGIAVNTPFLLSYESDTTPENVIAKFTNPYMREQAASGRQSVLGQALIEATQEEKIEEAKDELRKIKFVEPTEETLQQYSDVLKTAKVDLTRPEYREFLAPIIEDYAKDLQNIDATEVLNPENRAILENMPGLEGLDLSKKENQEIAVEALKNYAQDLLEMPISELGNSEYGPILENFELDLTTSKMKPLAIKYLSNYLREDVEISDEELLKKENQELLKSSKLDMPSIEKAVDAMFWEDSNFTEDQKFAIQMWKKTPVLSPVKEQYYVDEIEDIVNDPEKMKEFTNDKGELLPLSELVTKFDNEIESPGTNIPENVRQQLVFQAMGRVRNIKFQEKFIDKKEAKDVGDDTWDYISEGIELRKEQLSKLTQKLEKSMPKSRDELETKITLDFDKQYGVLREDLENLSDSPIDRHRYTEAISYAFTEVEKLQIPESQRAGAVMKMAEERYDSLKGEGAKSFEESGAKNLFQRSAFSEDSGGKEIWDKYSKDMTVLSTAEGVSRVWETVDKKIQQYASADKEFGELDLSARDISLAFAEMVPKVLVSGGELKLDEKLTPEILKEMNKLITDIKSGESTTDIIARVEKLASGLGVSSQEMKKNVEEKFLSTSIADEDTKQMGTNVKKMGWNIYQMYLMMAEGKGLGTPTPYSQSTGVMKERSSQSWWNELLNGKKGE